MLQNPQALRRRSVQRQLKDDRYPVLPKTLMHVDGKLLPASGENCIPDVDGRRKDDDGDGEKQSDLYRENLRKVKKIYRKLQKDSTGSVALSDLQDAFKAYLDPSFAKTLLNLLPIVDSDGRPHYTIGELLRVTEVMRPGFPKSDIPAWLPMSVHKAKKGDWSQIRDTVIEAMELNCKGNLHMADENFAEAFACFDQAASLHPQNKTIRNNRAAARQAWEDSARVPIVPYLKSVDVATMRRLLAHMKFRLDDQVDAFVQAMINDESGVMTLHMLRGYKEPKNVFFGIEADAVNERLLVTGMCILSGSPRWEKIEVILDHMAAERPDKKLSRGDIVSMSQEIYKAAGRLVQVIMPSLAEASTVTSQLRTALEPGWNVCVDAFFRQFVCHEGTRIRTGDFARWSNRNVNIKAWMDALEKAIYKEIFNPSLKGKTASTPNNPPAKMFSSSSISNKSLGATTVVPLGALGRSPTMAPGTLHGRRASVSRAPIVDFDDGDSDTYGTGSEWSSRPSTGAVMFPDAGALTARPNFGATMSSLPTSSNMTIVPLSEQPRTSRPSSFRTSFSNLSKEAS